MAETWTLVRSTLKRESTGLALIEATANMAVKKLSFEDHIGFGDEFEIDSIRCIYATTGTVGNRRLNLRLQKTIASVDQIFFQLESVAILAASSVKTFQWLSGVASQMQGLTNLASTTTSYEPLPEKFVLYRGQDLVIAEVGGVSGDPIDAGDDTTIFILGKVR